MEPLGDPEYWNRRLKDIDARIASNEIEHGRAVFRERVDKILAPLIDEVRKIADGLRP